MEKSSRILFVLAFFERLFSPFHFLWCLMTFFLYDLEYSLSGYHMAIDLSDTELTALYNGISLLTLHSDFSLETRNVRWGE